MEPKQREFCRTEVLGANSVKRYVVLTFVAMCLVFMVMGSQVAAAQTFVHPGVLVSKAQLDFIKAQVNAHVEPAFSAYQNAISHPYGSLTPTVTPSNSLAAGPSPAGPPSGGVIDCGSSSSPDNGCTADDEDGAVAYVQALLWYITGNQTYANNAIKNLNAYSHVTSFTNSNGPLQAAWSSSKWPRAAEIIRYSNAGWSAADATAFGNMMNSVMVPPIHNGSSNNPNWELSMIEGMIGIAVYNNDATLYNHALGMLNADIPRFVQSSGQNAETCRDMGHALFELAAMIDAAETVHIQGGNVYETQKALLSATLDFHAGLLLGRSEPVTCSVTLTPDRPTFVIGYNEYHNRLGMTLTNTHDWLPTVFANSVTSPGAAPGTPVDHHIVVYETLTHGADAGTVLQPDFSLTATPSSQTISAGGSTSYTASVSPVNSFTGSVALTVSGLPSGASASFNPSSISGGTGSSTLSITTNNTVAPGNYTLTITGTSGGSTSHTATVTLSVNAQADFTLAANPNSLSVIVGNSTSSTVSVGALNGFSGSVALSVSGVPTGVTASLSPTSVSGSGSSTLSVSTGSSAVAGTYTLTVTGTSGGLTHSASVTLQVNPVQQPDFTVSANPTSLTVNAGSSGSSTVSVGVVNGFSGAVALSVSGAPAGVTATLSSSSVNAPGSATLTVSAPSSAAASTSTLTITGTNGSTSHTATVNLTVKTVSQCVSTTTNGPWQNAAFANQTGTFTATYDATPSASPINAVVGLSNGVQTAYTGFAVITRFNPSGNIDARSGGAYTATNIIPYSGGVTYHFRVVVNIAAHTYAAYVTPQNGTEQTISTNLSFRTEQATVSQLNWVGAFSEVGTEMLCNFTLPSAADFALSATPASQTVTAGGSTSYTVNVTPSGGFSGAVGLSVNGAPAGVTATLNPTSVTGSGSSTLSVSTGSSAVAGTYTLTVTGTSGGLTHSASVSLVVQATQAADFSLAASPSTVTVTAGSAASYTASVSPINGYTGTVTLSASGLPSGATASFNPASISGGSGSSTLTVSTASSTLAGSYTVTITGKDTSGSPIHTTNVTLTVNPVLVPNFSLSATPASQTVTAGSNTSYTASVSPVNGYTGTVTLSASGLPSGATASFSPASISGGSGSSTLTITTTSSTTTGTVTVTIGGTDGSLTHTTTVSLTVNPGGTCAHGNGPLDPNATPGCNFDMSIWSLQLPIGSPGSPTTISNTQLENGFTDPYFFTGSDGAMDFFDPGVNCVTTANSTHCRSELREVNPDGSNAVWSASGTNTLSATLTVTQAAGAPVVGQIHDDPAVSVRPLIELFYTSSGDVVAGVEQCTAGGCINRTTVGHVPPGTKFSYVISYSQNKLTVSINGGAPVSLSSPILGIGGYFKAGDYGQSPTNASVSFYSLKVVHTP
ncbi:MAG TPA: polysaccharide lyase family 7 protein [Terriglobales bacterium]|nr:polysaccharide lyase family 7 protein [Terriglobales bacterium]